MAQRCLYRKQAKQFVSMYMFDMHSTLHRKNPQASVEVFRQFSEQHPDTHLILKVNRWENIDLSHMKWIPDHPRIRVVKETLDADEIADLYKSSDCYLSLHRSEGFGRTLVEALQHGLYVISSHYSGPADYLNSENSHSVEWDHAEVKPGQYPYLTISSQWSEPQKHSALSRLKEVYALSKHGRNQAGISTGESFTHEQLALRYRPILESYLNSY